MGVIHPNVRRLYFLRLGVVFITFGSCKSLRLRVINRYVRELYFISLGVVNAYV